MLRFLSLTAICLGLVGCQAFSKKPQGQANGGAAPSAAVPPRLGKPNTLPPANSNNKQTSAPGPAAAPNGLLAGQVLDSYNRPPPTTYIQVTSAAEATDPPGAPITREVEVNNQGYFTIEGLQPGRHYQLIARARDGDRLMAGRTWATPPNPKVLIKISEDFATADTPAVPDSPSIPRGRADSGWAPSRVPNADSSKPADLGTPVPGGATPPSQTNVRPQDVAGNQRVARNESPTVNMNGPGGGQTPVPSCVLTGRQLQNFALNDINGRPWEYRNHRGRLVLIDFWGTYCIPCLDTIPHLTDLQQRFGGYGLEVVGVAYEQGGSWQDQVQRINRVRQRLRINYTLLVGAGSQCPVQTQFQVASLPTLVLVDESNQIIWRHEGGIDRPRLNELDAILKQQLGLR